MLSAPLTFALIILLGTISPAVAGEYYGVYLGSLQNATYGISGDVFLANATTIQIVNFNVNPQVDDPRITLVVSSAEDAFPLPLLYKWVSRTDDDATIVPIRRIFDKGVNGVRLVGTLPASSDRFTNIGLVSVKSWNYLATVRLNKPAPQPFCCLPPIQGHHYNASSGPIVVLDAKTVQLQAFSLDGTQAPDGWIFAGNGDSVERHNGRKAMVLNGSDTPKRQCSLKRKYTGDAPLTARLMGQSVYEISFLSIFCYQYDVDFGHVDVQLSPDAQPVPAYVPPIRSPNAMKVIHEELDANSCPQ